MADTEEEFPDVGAEPYELRFTRRALDDLGVPRDTPRGSRAKVRAGTSWRDIVDEFFEQRSLSPESTGGYLARCGRGDIAELHSTRGGRAATWYDRANEVVWFVGFTPDHDYGHIEARAAHGELLPDSDDYVILDLEREERDFADRVKADLNQLLCQACSSPETPVKGRVGRILRLEVIALVMALEEETMGDIYVLVKVPPIDDASAPPPGWPADHLQERIAELVCGDEPAVWDAPAQVPDGQGSMRDVDYSRELPIVVRSADLGGYLS